MRIPRVPRCLFAVLLLPCLLPAASERILEAQLTDVTVFADRAELVRHAQLELPSGSHTLVFADLPVRTDRDSLQVDGSGGFVLQDVRFETRQLTELPEGRLKDLNDSLEANAVKQEALALAGKRLKDNRATLEAIIARVTAPPRESTEPAVIDVQQWGKLLEFYNRQLEELDEAAMQNVAEVKVLKAEASRLQRDSAQLNALARRESNTAKVLISLEHAGRVVITLKSIVYGPGWVPGYDIRANTVTRDVAITSYGNVTQNTGEDWSNVRLSLSTAQPQIGGREPQMNPWFIREYKPEVYAAASGRLNASNDVAAYRRGSSNLMQTPQMMPTPDAGLKALAEVEQLARAEAPMQVRQAGVQSGATAVVYAIAGDVSINGDNQPVRVAITTQSFPGHFRYSAIPKLSPHVYLKAKVTNTSDYAFLPGQGNIYLDGGFVGKTTMNLVQPGSEFWTWLGVDQGVSVERKVLDRTEGTSGFFTSSKSLTSRYEFNIRNNKQDAIELVVWDQLPIAENSNISVELLQPKFTGDTDTLKMNSQKYIEWLYHLAPGQTVKTPFEFRVTWPESMQLSGM